MLLVQADGGLGAVFLLVEETKELLVILPVPTGVADVREAFALDLTGDLVEVGKTSGEGGLFGRSVFSRGSRSARMRVRISSQGRKSQLRALSRPSTQLPVM